MWYVGRCNSVYDPLGTIYVPNKTNAVNLNVCNIIMAIHESRTLTKCISYTCRCKFNSRQKCNNNKGQWEYENCQSIVYAKKIMLIVPSYEIQGDKDCEFGEYFKTYRGWKSLIDDSIINCVDKL